MRFGIVTPQLDRHSGQGRVNLEIANEALRQGHEVTIITECDDASPARQTSAARSVLLTPPRWVPSRLLRDQLFAWRTRAVIARERPHCDALLGNGFVTWARCDVSAAHFVHDSWLRSAHHPWRIGRDARSLYALLYSWLNVTLERMSFRRAAWVVAVSQSVASDLQRSGVPPQRITTISNGVDSVEFHPGPARRPQFDLPDGVPIALFAGDIKSARKNLDTVLRALALVPGLHLAVAARHQGTAYPELAGSLGVAERVHFLGFRTDMPELMRAVDMFVFPSRYEPSGLVLLEALASGLPVVTARNVGGAELIEPGVGFVLDDGEDPVALAEALRVLVTQEEHRLAMAQSARALAERHSWSAMARRYIDLLVKAAQEPVRATHPHDAQRCEPKAASVGKA